VQRENILAGIISTVEGDPNQQSLDGAVCRPSGTEAESGEASSRATQKLSVERSAITHAFGRKLPSWVAAYFSITGMTILFPGAVAAVIAMACSMEAGKLVGTAWLAHHWKPTSQLLRAALTVLIVTLA
jgi:hypothetical protein